MVCTALARLRCGKRGDDRFLVTNLTKQDHIRRLTHDVPHGGGVVGRVEPDLALVDHRLAVEEDVLDRILDGDDVPRVVVVHVLHHRGERRALAGAGRAGDQHETALQRSERFELLAGQVEVLHRRNDVHDVTEDEREATLLAEDVRAKATHAVDGV
jgi:hypothetical protein